MRVAVVIPAFNEARTIRDVVAAAVRDWPLVIVVDDGSADGTADALAGLPARLIRHPANAGKAAALRSGFDAAIAEGVDYVATLDGDGQHDPADLRRLAAAAKLHDDMIVIGARIFDRGNAPLSRRIANRIADFWISWAAGYPIADSQSGMRLYPAALLSVVDASCDRHASFTFESEVLIDAGRRDIRSVAVPIRTVYAANARPSHFRPVRDISRIVITVARALLARGMYPLGLWNSLRATPTLVGDCEDDDQGVKVGT